MRKRIAFILGILGLDAIPAAHSGSYSKTELLSVRAPNPQVPSDCDPTYRNAMASTLSRQWQQCQTIGAAQPSVCQRRLFDLCVRAAQEIARQAASSCVATSSAGAQTGQARGTVGSQVSSNVSAGAVTGTGARKTEAYLQALKDNKSAFDKVRAVEAAATQKHACKKSSLAGAYQKLGRDLEKNAADASRFVQGLSAVKTKNRDQLESLERRAGARKALLGSATAPGARGATAGNTSPETQAPSGSEPLVRAALAPARLFGLGNGGNPLKSGPTYGPTDDAFFQRGPTGTVKYTAHGAPAVVTLVNDFISPETAVAEKAAMSELVDDLESPPVLTPEQISSAGPGTALFSKLQIKVDTALTDVERSANEAAIKMTPHCLHGLLRNGVIARGRLPQPGDGSCQYGMMNMIVGGEDRYWIRYDACQSSDLTPANAVHEIYHVIGFSNNERFHIEFMKFQYPFKNNQPYCPISPYGGKSYYEDFAEAGVRAHFAQGDAGGANHGACVDEKMRQFRRIVGCR